MMTVTAFTELMTKPQKVTEEVHGEEQVGRRRKK
jgi:hypothetical protein